MSSCSQQNRRKRPNGVAKREREEPEQNDERLVETLREQIAGLQRENAEQARIIDSQNAEVSSLRELKQACINKIFAGKGDDNDPMKAFWRSLKDVSTQGIEVPMAIVMDPRCGIEQWVKNVDIFGRGYDGSSTPLMLAIHEGRNDVVAALLAAGANYEAADSEGTNTLMTAGMNENLSAMELLIRYGADVNMADSEGHTALYFASLYDNDTGVEALCRHGANTGAASDGDTTALHMAAASSKSESLEILLEFGADVEAVNERGFTPLHDAADAGKADAIEVLVWEGASISAKDENGKTPLDLFNERTMREPTFEDTYLREKIESSEQEPVRILLTPKVLQ